MWGGGGAMVLSRYVHETIRWEKRLSDDFCPRWKGGKGEERSVGRVLR